MNRLRNLVWVMAGLAALTMVGAFTSKPLLAQIKAAFVESVDEPGRNPFQSTVEFSGNFPSICRAIPTSPQVCDVDLGVVPSGKRLVITNVTGMVFVDTPGVIGRIQFLPGPTVSAFLLAGTIPGGLGLSENLFSINAPVRFFVEAGFDVRLRLNATTPVAVDNNGTAGSSITVSGYYVNL